MALGSTVSVFSALARLKSHTCTANACGMKKCVKDDVIVNTVQRLYFVLACRGQALLALAGNFPLVQGVQLTVMNNNQSNHNDNNNIFSAFQVMMS